jgi:hypothetical protein
MEGPVGGGTRPYRTRRPPLTIAPRSPPAHRRSGAALVVGLKVDVHLPTSSTVQPQPWDEIAKRFNAMADDHKQFRHMAMIAESVIESASTGLLAGVTSMHDIMVVSKPVPDPPFEVGATRAPGSLQPPKTGNVLIEHLACSGHNDRIERPTSEAVPLFWRFMIKSTMCNRPIRLGDAREGTRRHKCRS